MGQEISYEGARSFSLSTPMGVFKGITLCDPKTGEKLCHRFTGVKYALGESKRWAMAKPIPEDYDYSVKEYTKIPPACPQPEIVGKLEYINYQGEFDEDCYYLNIWVPASLDLTKLELPVLFYIHGGWLQYGSANHGSLFDPRTLQSSFTNNFIIVAPAYRLNSIGFLSTKHLANEGSNFGLWDQRMALEWTSKFIGNFGGDSEKITVGGLSAGSYSTFFQLAYEMYHPEEKQIIKQVVHFSNCVIVQPKYIEETESQFEEYVEVLGIDTSLSGAEKIEALRSISSEKLMSAIQKMKMHTFRAITDNSFVSPTLLRDIYSGDYGVKLYNRKIRIMIGEVDNEPWMYSYLNTPKTQDELPLQLQNYYPKTTIKALLDIYDKSGDLEELRKDFGLALADSQIYASTRSFLHNCLKQKPELFKSIFRYRISYAPGYVRKFLDEHGIEGIIHSNDQMIWFFSHADELSPEETKIIKEFITPYVNYINMSDIEWGTESITEYKYLDAQGGTSIVKDMHWDEYMKISERLYQEQLPISLLTRLQRLIKKIV